MLEKDVNFRWHIWHIVFFIYLFICLVEVQFEVLISRYIFYYHVYLYNIKKFLRSVNRNNSTSK